MRPRFWERPVLLLVAFQCSLLPRLLQAQTPETPGDSGQAVNLAVFIEGQVSIKRKGWANYAPVVFGTTFRTGDLIHVEESSHAKVVCSDLTLHDIAVGIGGVPCVTARPLLRRADGSMINVTRSWPSDGSFPIVLSPRKTKLLSFRPQLRWTPVEGANVYDVAVRGLNFFWTSRVRSLTEIPYPDGAPRLEAGVDYKLIVQTRDRSSADEPGLGLGFAILGSKERKRVEEEQRRVEGLGLTEGPTQFLIAYLYATHGLNAEAIQRLESVAQTLNVAAVARLLGGLYLEVGLTRQAEARYLNSLDLSKFEKDEEGEMRTHLALAGIYEQGLGNEKLAQQHLDATLALAKKMGDDQTVSQAEKKLTELKRAAM